MDRWELCIVVVGAGITLAMYRWCGDGLTAVTFGLCAMIAMLFCKKGGDVG